MKRRWILPLLVLAGLVTGGVMMAKSAEAARHDTRRETDLNQVRTQLNATKPAPTILDSAPKDPETNQPYQYRAAGDSFMACGVFERYDRRQAYFVTASGSFRADSRFCTEPIDPVVAGIVTDAGLTERAIQVFLESQPTIADRQTIKRQCSTSDEKVAIYGCYDKDGRIWILQVTDPALAGLTTVAGVHELLHAVQVRTPPNYAALIRQTEKLNDQLLNEELALYSQTDRLNEMHARLGTEYPSLDPDVEAEYAQVFNRQAVVTRYQPYASLVREIQRLKSQLDASQSRLDQLESQGHIEKRNALVDGHNRKVREYNALANRYNLLTE